MLEDRCLRGNKKIAYSVRLGKLRPICLKDKSLKIVVSGFTINQYCCLSLSWARHCAAKGGCSKSPTILGCIAGSAILRKAALLAFEKKRSTLTTDMIECLGESLEERCPVSQ
ncbi:unnamed protein product [Fraxinus pennsylvanica]|uniref:Uncharacterized protein n=1 Tax=Fraxinus pennsylvanica TaxID=56036 RepID=A0AAD2E4C9_9LAMI|nr:unnamed protein product [Fraxinus pennsylvanica]